MEHIEHRFGPGETIKAIIRKYNKQKVTPTTMSQLSDQYIQLNEQSVPRVGDTCKIPLHDFSVDELIAVPIPQPVPVPEINVPPIQTNSVKFVPSDDNDIAMISRQKRRELARLRAHESDRPVSIEPYVEPSPNITPIDPPKIEIDPNPKPKKKKRVVPVNPVVKKSASEDNIPDKKNNPVVQSRRTINLRRRRR